MLKILKYTIYFLFLAGLGILLGCFIHGWRVNQTTVMSGVAFVRELPYGEKTVGLIETMVFSWQEEQDLKRFRKEHEGKIQIDPEVMKKHEELYRKGGSNR
ncbi:MAG: hypothetical protein HY914_05315 [Desulfomonile tiedjei]|nr:hypothetical protein [Desulfomonile tiedjei]